MYTNTFPYVYFYISIYAHIHTYIHTYVYIYIIPRPYARIYSLFQKESYCPYCECIHISLLCLCCCLTNTNRNMCNCTVCFGSVRFIRVFYFRFIYCIVLLKGVFGQHLRILATAAGNKRFLAIIIITTTSERTLELKWQQL